jgi:Tfp pilus assembly protein PilN
MIKINLLGAPKPKRGKAGRGPATTVVDVGGGGGPNPVVMIIMAIAIAAAVVGFGWYRENARAAQIAADIKKADTENRRLAAVKAKFDQEQRVKENYERRVKVIDDLRANQSGPVNLLTMIADTVNSTDAVWLNNMLDTGTAISIDGSALSANAVANLVRNLEKTGYFKSVEMTETQQDPQAKDIQQFGFKLTCTKQPPSPSQQKS